MADGVIGARCCQQVVFVGPAHSELIACHFDPHAVNAVLGDDGDSSNDNMVLMENKEAVTRLCNTLTPMHRTVFLQQEAIGMDMKIVANAVGTRQLGGLVRQLAGGEQQRQSKEKWQDVFHVSGVRTNIRQFLQSKWRGKRRPSARRRKRGSLGEGCLLTGAFVQKPRA